MVGAGLAGLTAAATVHAGGMSVAVLEARASVGGRIRALTPEGLGDGAWFDLGATWHWSNQSRVRALAEELGVGTFAQFRTGRAMVDDPALGPSPVAVDVPPPSPAELRFVGGAATLCDRLVARLPPATVRFRTEVVEVERRHDAIALTLLDDDGGTSVVGAGFVVMAVPPRLVAQDIAFIPALEAEMIRVMRATPTWMAQAMKCVAVYDRPFWREAGLSGQAFSRGGPLVEVHDACTADGSSAALWGFVSGDHAHRDLGFDQRLPAVFSQLSHLFGPAAADPVQYFERDWSDDPYTNDEVVWPGEPLGYGHAAFGRPAMDGRLFWAGSETSAVGGGHMEGAVRSGRRAADLVLEAAGVGPQTR